MEEGPESKAINFDLKKSGAERRLVDCTIGFLLFQNRERTEENFTSAGSGVLVRIGKIFGILTAAHVLDVLPKTGEIGVVRFPRDPAILQQLILRMEDTKREVIGKNNESVEGPDIGFLRLPQEFADTIGATNSFYNLEMSHERIVEGVLQSKPAVFMTVGVVDKHTVEIAPSRTRTRSKEYELWLQNGFTIKLPAVENLDRVLFTPNVDGDLQLPESFCGTSGGGLWRISFNVDAEHNYSLAEINLVGVVYYESPGDVTNLVLICHGPVSIYQQLMDRIVARWRVEI